MKNSDGRIRIPRAIRMQGFTLMESLVAVSVFGFAAASIVGVYLSIQRLNQKSAGLQVIQQNARFISEDLTRTIRNGRIDYARYGSSVPQPWYSDLFLLDRDNTQVRIFASGEAVKISRGAAPAADLTGPEVRVLNFRAYVWPSSNPFPGGAEQPTVTIFMDLESKINERDKARAPFQFTVTTRQYPE